MKKLIEALNIFLKYKDLDYPTHCEHDILMISGISFDEVSEEDIEHLKELNFSWHEEHDCFTSYRYGSA